jgi:sugar-specific transcriptional regulator TrmB
MNEDLSHLLTGMGFTEYEARAYLALLHESPLTGYAVARVSGVPRSKIYEVLGSLVERGDVLVSHGEPTQYVPRPPRELIETRRQRAEKQFAEAEKGLEQFVHRAPPTELIWDIRGREEILFRVRDVIGRAREQILLELWEEDAPEIRAALEQAARQGIPITAVSYGKAELPFARVYEHEPGADEIAEEYGGRWIIVSIDAREIVAGIVSLGKNSQAAWSAHLGMVMPITEQIKHDIYIAELLAAHRDVLEASFGPSLSRLRDQFNRDYGKRVRK